MSFRFGTLDCTPLSPDSGARLASTDLRRIEPVQRALLSPLDHETIDDWRRAVNRALMTAFDSDAAMFQLEADGVPVHCSDQFDENHLRSYRELMPELAQEQRLFRRTVTLKAGNRSILWGDDLEWLYGSEYFHTLVVELRAYDPLWASAEVPGGRFPAVITTYHDRRQSARFFGAADVALMAAVQPALAAGVRTVFQTASSRRSLTAALDLSTVGALVYDTSGHLLHQSAGLTTLARTRRDERVLAESGRGMARGLGSEESTESLEPRHSTRTVRGDAAAYELTAVLLGEGVFTLRPAVLVTVTRPALSLPDRATLRERFGLTRRQAEVALLLAQRKTNPEIAELLCISPYTARGHAEAVMGKLAVHDRREILRAIVVADEASDRGE